MRRAATRHGSKASSRASIFPRARRAISRRPTYSSRARRISPGTRPRFARRSRPRASCGSRGRRSPPGRHRRHRGHHSRGGAADGLRRREGVRRERGVVGIEACHPQERKAMMDILTQVRDAIMAVELNRPQKKNAPTTDTYAALAEARAPARADPAAPGPAGTTRTTGWEAARKFAPFPAKSVRTTKPFLKGAHAGAVRSQMQLEGRHFREMLSEPAAKEAFAAFIEKRKPDFSRIA